MPVCEGWTGHAVDVAVVGGGAAGIGAARRLMASRPDLRLVVLEAADRPGGRAHTVDPAGVPVDLGCGWLHGARTNAWTGIAGELGYAVDRTPAPWDDGGRDLALSPKDDRGARRALGAFFARAEERAATDPDLALAALLRPGGRWNNLIDAVGTYINGVELGAASLRDYGRYDPGPGPDWRVRDGYGRLVAAYGAPVAIALGTAVRAIDHSRADGVRIDTARGALLTRAVIVTVSTDVLAAGAIRFEPPLPDKLAAAADLPLGLADKLFLAVSAPCDLPRDGNLMGSPHRTGTGAYQTRPFGDPVIECYFAGALAHDLEKGGEAAAFAFAAEELASHFGTGIRERIAPAACSAWARDGLVRGSYSYAKPGRAHARETLSAPVDDRLFFAGEACSSHRFSTAHGAYETGVAAADAATTALGALRP